MVRVDSLPTIVRSAESYVINVRGFISASSSSTYSAIAPRNGYIPGRRCAKCAHLALHKVASLERRRFSRLGFRLYHRNAQVTGEVEDPKVHRRDGRGRGQGTVAGRVGQERPGYGHREGRLLDRE